MVRANVPLCGVSGQGYHSVGEDMPGEGAGIALSGCVCARDGVLLEVCAQASGLAVRY